MKNLIIVIIVLFIFGCNTSTEVENKNLIFKIESISTRPIEEHIKSLDEGVTNVDIPIDIIIRKLNNKYYGFIIFYKLGYMPIENYKDNSEFKNYFYINTEGKLPNKIERISFKVNKITNKELEGVLFYDSIMIEDGGRSFVAKVK